MVRFCDTPIIRFPQCTHVYFKRGTETCSQIACDVGPMTIQHDSETIPLTSFEQLKELVSQSIDALTQPP